VEKVALEVRDMPIYMCAFHSVCEKKNGLKIRVNVSWRFVEKWLQHTETHCNSLQHTQV